MQSKARLLHAKAAKAREEGKFTDSLDLNDKALFAYDAENDALGFAEGIACRSITLRTYAYEHGNSKKNPHPRQTRNARSNCNSKGKRHKRITRPPAL